MTPRAKPSTATAPSTRGQTAAVAHAIRLAVPMTLATRINRPVPVRAVIQPTLALPTR
jgi:hypothetical protein